MSWAVLAVVWVEYNAVTHVILETIRSRLRNAIS